MKYIVSHVIVKLQNVKIRVILKYPEYMGNFSLKNKNQYKNCQ